MNGRKLPITIGDRLLCIENGSIAVDREVGEFIVKAVKHHNELVAALEKARTMIERIYHHNPLFITDALTKAGVE